MAQINGEGKMGVARISALFVAILLMIGLLWILIAGSTISYGEELCTSQFPKDSNFIKWTGDKAVNINAEFNKKPMKPVWRRDG